MARKVFFSFHYDGDILRVGQIRNSGVIKSGMDGTGFIDEAEWESIKQKGKEAIKGWIDEQLNGTSVTVVLIGRETADREWVEYEIKESFRRGNGLLGIFIHKVKDLNGKTTKKGKNPITKYRIRNIKTYDWFRDDGRGNLAQWVENAYKQAAEKKEAEKSRKQGSESINAEAVIGFVVIAGLVLAGIGWVIDKFGGNKDNS